DDELRELQDRELPRIAEVEHLPLRALREHRFLQPRHQIGYVGEAARLRPVTVDRDRVSNDRLVDEIRHHTTVIRLVPRSVRILRAHPIPRNEVLAAGY